MKNTILAFFLLLGFGAVSAQTTNDLVKKQFLDYSQLIADGKFEQAIEYTMEDLFEIVPKEQLISLMEAVFRNPDMEIRTGLPTILEMDPVKKIDGMNYVRFTNKTSVEMKFLAKPGESDQKEKDEKVLSTFQSTYGKENVSFDPVSRFFKITATKTAIARSKDLKTWEFAVIDNPRMKTVLSEFIPAELLD